MGYRCTYARPGKVGEVSSKYGFPGGGEAFERDIVQHLEEAEALYQDFVEWMKSRNVTPEDVRRLFTRFYEEHFGA